MFPVSPVSEYDKQIALSEYYIHAKKSVNPISPRRIPAHGFATLPAIDLSTRAIFSQYIASYHYKQEAD